MKTSSKTKGHWLKALLTPLSIALIGLYPLIIFFGIAIIPLPVMVSVMALIFAVRYFTLSEQHSELKSVMRLILMIALILCLCALLFRSLQVMLYYPVVVNGVMLSVFARSLYVPPPIIERLARLRTPDLPKAGIAYTRTVTKVWVGFFILNGSLAYLTTQMDFAIWTLYNGLISYGLMGALFIGEWCVRQRCMAKT
ncbi:hypothetical protein [Wohlfahrtiimonas chitiniclastica]|uniref:COG4648 family protein n=1 Tax=Wohlfahrtiimonas chitiniclastica TaxID=400946 RepID=UPI001BCAAD5F|nr:hypothetical protein [Wohlfahrtiimonas chitiniclastica]MBS7836203.1 hypothetical protein [Wohlfahrtiimonas chitiniclastica]